MTRKKQIVQELRDLGMDCDDHGKRVCDEAANLIEKMSMYVINRVMSDHEENEQLRQELRMLRYQAAGPGR